MSVKFVSRSVIKYVFLRFKLLLKNANGSHRRLISLTFSKIIDSSI